MKRPRLAVCLFAAVGTLQGLADASLLGGRDTVHRIQKVHIVEHAVLEKRELACPTDYYSCAASLGGNCCPERYGCATDSCFVTTAGTRTACGMVGYYGCPLQSGGGCCPEGYVCGSGNQCFPPAGVTWTLSCPAGKYRCDESAGGGCCASGMACGKSLCYATTPQTFVFTKTSTVQSDGTSTTMTTTITTVSTYVPTSFPSNTDQGLPKLFVTAVDKVLPTEVPEQSQGGLTRAQIGGIAGGSVALVLIITAATFFIFRRFKRHEKIMAGSGAHGASSVGGQSSLKTDGKKGVVQVKVTPYPVKPTQSAIEAMDYDDLLMNGTVVSSTAPTVFNRADSDIASILSSRPTPDPRHVSTDYIAVDQSDHSDLGAAAHARRGSTQAPGSLTQHRSSLESQATSVSGMAELMSSPAVATAAARRNRHTSNASDISWAGSAELPASLSLGLQGIPAELGQGQQVSELHGSDDASHQGHRRQRSGGASAPASPTTSVAHPPIANQRNGQNPLDVLSENVEYMHGYYGPGDHSGQTEAGLALGHDISSPLATTFQEAQQEAKDKKP